jgi:hypothetical protein
VIPSRAGLLVAAAAAVFAPLLPMTIAVQTTATLATLALLLLELKYIPGGGAGQPEQAPDD